MEAGCSPNFIVLGAHAEILKPEVDSGVFEILENPGWQEGMGSSIRVAMKSLFKRPTLPGAVLLLYATSPTYQQVYWQSCSKSTTDGARRLLLRSTTECSVFPRSLEPITLENWRCSREIVAREE